MVCSWIFRRNIPIDLLSLKIIAELNDALFMKQVVSTIFRKNEPLHLLKNLLGLALGSSRQKANNVALPIQDNAFDISKMWKEEAFTKNNYLFFLKLLKLVTKGLHDLGYDICLRI